MTVKGVWHACHHHWCMYVYFINLPQTGEWGREGGKRRRVCTLWPVIVHITWNTSIYLKHFRLCANLHFLDLRRFSLFRAYGATSSASYFPQWEGVSIWHFPLCLTVTYCVQIQTKKNLCMLQLRPDFTAVPERIEPVKMTGNKLNMAHNMFPLRLSHVKTLVTVLKHVLKTP